MDKNYIYGPGNILLGHLSKSDLPLAGEGGQKGGTQPSNPSNSSNPSKSPTDAYSYYFYVTDQLGSIRKLISNNDIVGDYYYDEYGKRFCSNPYGCGNTSALGFTGQYTDDESNLLYMRARYYDPSTQQFLTRDPLGASAGQPYAYADRNPVNYTDPSGLQTEEEEGGLEGSSAVNCTLIKAIMYLAAFVDLSDDNLVDIGKRQACTHSSHDRMTCIHFAHRAEYTPKETSPRATTPRSHGP